MSIRRSRHNTVPPIVFIGFVLGHGGDAAQMLDLASGLADRGHRVKIVVPALETTVEFADRAASRSVVVERSRLIRAELGGMRQNPAQILALLARYRRSLVHFHTGDVFLPRTVGLAMRVLRPPRAIVTVHSPWDDVDDARRAASWVITVDRHIATVVCPSRHSRESQIRYGVDPARVRTIFNAVDVERFGRGRPEHAHAALGLGPEAKLVVFSSRLDAQKRPVDAVTAFSKVATTHADAHLVFVGRGLEEADVRRAAAASGLSERIHFVGFQQRVEDWLAAATVWFLPTESENFSIAVLEAMAAGCAIVTTNCRGNDEVLRDGENAWLTAVGDVEAQASAIDRLLCDPDQAAQLRDTARADAGFYGLGRMIDEYQETYAAADRSVTA